MKGKEKMGKEGRRGRNRCEWRGRRREGRKVGERKPNQFKFDINTSYNWPTSSLTLLVAIQPMFVTEQVYTPASLSARLSITSSELPVLLVMLKEKNTPTFFPADLWSRNTRKGAHQFKVVSLSVSRWCWQARQTCGEEKNILCTQLPHEQFVME